MKKLLLASVAAMVVALAAPVAQAAVLSISDANETLGLSVNLPTQSTTLPNPPPGGGSPIDITTPTPSNGVSNIHYVLTPPPADPLMEGLSFTFANQVAWGSNVLFFRYYREQGGRFSDLFVIRGVAGTVPDHIMFVSSDLLVGDFATDISFIEGISPGLFPDLGVNFDATPQDLGAITELPQWQLAYDTGVDQYYINSVPEPSALAMLGFGLLGLGFMRRRRG